MKAFITATLVLPLLLGSAFVVPQAQAQTVLRDGSSESRTERQQRVSQYRRQSSEIQKKINALPKNNVEDIAIPVLFGVALRNITPNFGDPRDGGARTHEGEDIMATKGTPIVSPTEAVVLRTGTGESEGNYVYTANPGGETFVYMHLTRVGEGVKAGLELNTGDLIGYVGNTGNASGGPAHLHFEIHDGRDPIDPYPRLTEEFSLKDKMSYLEDILKQSDDEDELADFLAANFRSTFVQALAANVDIPNDLVAAIAALPAVSPAASGATLPAGDLQVGSSGSLVIALQAELIRANTGPAAAQLAAAGATGTFGPVTRAALIEYQAAAGISTTGYYGPLTRAYVALHPAGTSGATSPPATAPASAALSRDLYLGISGEDVRTLQKLLNANGYTVASAGAGSAGAETDYFGSATEAAVIKFQVAKHIAPAVGRMGPVTRAALLLL